MATTNMKLLRKMRWRLVIKKKHVSKFHHDDPNNYGFVITSEMFMQCLMKFILCIQLTHNIDFCLHRSWPVKILALCGWSLKWYKLNQTQFVENDSIGFVVKWIHLPLSTSFRCMHLALSGALESITSALIILLQELYICIRVYCGEFSLFGRLEMSSRNRMDDRISCTITPGIFRLFSALPAQLLTRSLPVSKAHINRIKQALSTVTSTGLKVLSTTFDIVRLTRRLALEWGMSRSLASD